PPPVPAPAPSWGDDVEDDPYAEEVEDIYDPPPASLHSAKPVSLAPTPSSSGAGGKSSFSFGSITNVFGKASSPYTAATSTMATSTATLTLTLPHSASYGLDSEVVPDDSEEDAYSIPPPLPLKPRGALNPTPRAR
ncbi:unnamed protein product, partial [Sphagnum balticum]